MDHNFHWYLEPHNSLLRSAHQKIEEVISDFNDSLDNPRECLTSSVYAGCVHIRDLWLQTGPRPVNSIISFWNHLIFSEEYDKEQYFLDMLSEKTYSDQQINFEINMKCPVQTSLNGIIRFGHFFTLDVQVIPYAEFGTEIIMLVPADN